MAESEKIPEELEAAINLVKTRISQMALGVKSEQWTTQDMEPWLDQLRIATRLNAEYSNKPGDSAYYDGLNAVANQLDRLYFKAQAGAADRALLKSTSKKKK